MRGALRCEEVASSRSAVPVFVKGYGSQCEAFVCVDMSSGDSHSAMYLVIGNDLGRPKLFFEAFGLFCG